MMDWLFKRFMSKKKDGAKVKVCGFCGSDYNEALEGCPVCGRLLGAESCYRGDANKLLMYRPYMSYSGLERLVIQAEKEIAEVELSPNKHVIIIRWGRYPPRVPEEEVRKRLRGDPGGVPRAVARGRSGKLCQKILLEEHNRSVDREQT